MLINHEKITAGMTDLLRRTGSENKREALAAQYEFAQAITLPLRKGVMSGNILQGIFMPDPIAPGSTTEYPLDFLAPGTEKDFIAYTMPYAGYIPQRQAEGDYVMIPTYFVANAIDWTLRYARDAKWNVIARFLQVLESGFVKKLNDDGWHTLLSAVVDRNILVFDSDATQGQFTKRLVSLMKTVMRRNGGGNSTSVNRRKLTDLYLSPEGLEDIRNWGVDQVDEITRREIYTAADGTVNRIFNVNLHDIDELGTTDQEYTLFYTSTLGASLASGDVELVVGLDLSEDMSFVMPVRQPVQIFEDDNLHRHGKAGYYGNMEVGFGVLDGRVCLAGSF